MTVGELIKILLEYDHHLPVQHFSDEEGNRISNATVYGLNEEKDGDIVAVGIFPGEGIRE